LCAYDAGADSSAYLKVSISRLFYGSIFPLFFDARSKIPLSDELWALSFFSPLFPVPFERSDDPASYEISVVLDLSVLVPSDVFLFPPG